MGYYIKITGRGYLKDVDLKYPGFGKFSKQLTLAYCGDTEAEATAYMNSILTALKKKRDVAKVIYEAALKIITFPDMFKGPLHLKAFLKKQGIDVKTNGYCYNGFPKLLQDINSGMIILDAITKFENSYYGFPEYKRSYNSLETACKLIAKGKVVELDNFNVTIKISAKRPVEWKQAAEKDNGNSGWKIPCTSCGAIIPGAKYFMVNYNAICPYCLQNYLNDVNREVNRLGPEMAKAYKKALFMENL